MDRTRAFETTISVSIAHGDEHEFALSLDYEFTPAFKGSWDEPGHDASAEITAIKARRRGEPVELPVWVADLIMADELLLDSLMADADESDASDRADAYERRADERRELRILGEA